MYDIADDIYCYPNSSVLRNLASLRSAEELEQFETAMTLQRSDEPLPAGRFSVAHYRAIHHHLFQDVYPWAGELRRIRIGKSGNWFCFPENIARELKELFSGLRQERHFRGLTKQQFVVNAAKFLAHLNAIHAFRDGNGRTQLAFLAMLADQAGFPLHRDQLHPSAFLQAMIVSFGGDETVLQAELARMIA